MALGDWLLIGALALAGAALASGALHLLTGRASAERRAVLLALGAVGLAVLAYLALLGHFLARDYSVFYVWNYSDDATPLYLRAAGVWAGSAGSVFLWAVLAGLVWAAEEFLRKRALRRGEPPGGERLHTGARLVALAVFAALLLLTLRAMPFAPTADFHFDAATGFFTHQPGLRGVPDPLDFRPTGFGLNPLLVTPFMAIHPPMEFVAYAAAAMPFAFAVAFLATRDPRWWGGAIFWGRVAWMAYAIALGLGALWAYYVLSFGGYWIWDPVEVGDLIPFLGLTAFLHAADMHRKGKGYPHYAPFLAALAWPLTLFGTFVTRSSYWISAHAFDVGQAAIVQDPALRLLAILAVKPQVAAFTSLLLASLAAVAALYLARFAWHRLRARPALGWPALLLLAAWVAVMLLALLDVRALLGGSFDLAAALGRGNLLLGLALLGLAMVALPVALMVWSLEDEAPAKVRLGDLAEPDALMSAGVVMLSLGLLVTIAVLLLGVNLTVTQLDALYKAREPLVALPLVLVMTMRLTVKSVGKARAAAWALGPLAAGALLYLLLPEGLRLLGLGVPVLGAALAAGVVQLMKAAGKASAAPRDAQRAGALLLLAGLAGMAMWASPPTALALGPLALQVPLAYVPVGLGASFAAFVLGVALMQGEGRRVALLGGAAALLAVGYGLGAALGLAALALAHRARGQLAPERPLRASLAHVKGRVYGTGRWAAHIGVVLVFIGYGASAYHAQEADYRDLSDPLVRGVPRAFGDYALTLADSRGLDADRDGTFEEVTADIAIQRGGRLLAVAPITFYWVEKESQYRPTEYVLRQPLEDLYLNSDTNNLPAMRTAHDGWVRSNQVALFALGQEPQKFRSDAVEAVSFSVKALPLVAPLWAGAVVLPFSMALTLAAAPPRAHVKKG